MNNQIIIEINTCRCPVVGVPGYKDISGVIYIWANRESYILGSDTESMQER